MSWTQELYNVYKRCSESKEGNTGLLPISHSATKAQIQVHIKYDGTIQGAELIEDAIDQYTVIPVSSASGKRSGKNPPPHPLADKLFYLAGDTKRYVDNIKYEAFHKAYINQLKQWCESDFSHPAIKIIYSYLEKGTLLADLIDYHVLKLKDGKLDEKDLSMFVRFYVIYTDFNCENRTWVDSTLYDAYTNYSLSMQSDAKTDLCYALGKKLPIMKNTEHSKQIVSRCANAKLLCLNDQKLTYTGRFRTDEEAVSVSYDFSQKMHNALRWLIQRQSVSADDVLISSTSSEERKEIKKKEAEKKHRDPFQFDSLQLIVWRSSLQPAPDILDSGLIDIDEEEYFDEEEKYDPGLDFHNRLRKQIYRKQELGSTAQIDGGEKVMLMGVDAATTGRLSIAIYEELEHSRLLEQLVRWHAETAALRFYAKRKISCPNSFAVREIISCAYGMENGKGFLEAKPEIIKDNVLRLLPCITQGRHLPADIVRNLVKKASNPLAYEHSYNHRTVLETACGMIRKQNIDRKEGIISMAFDPNETDRSYLFGCLLAIADAAEFESYDDNDKKVRVTNAKRFWSMFAKRPSSTWAEIYDKLNPYLIKLKKDKPYFYTRCMKKMNEIKDKFTLSDFSDNSPLSPAYLLGYHHFNAEIYKKSENDRKNEEE